MYLSTEIMDISIIFLDYYSTINPVPINLHFLSTKNESKNYFSLIISILFDMIYTLIIN